MSIMVYSKTFFNLHYVNEKMHENSCHNNQSKFPFMDSLNVLEVSLQRQLVRFHLFILNDYNTGI